MTAGGAQVVLGYLLSVGLRGGVLLALAALIALMLRRRSASLRHLVWAAGLAALAAVTALSWLLPAWQVPSLPARPLAVLELFGDGAPTAAPAVAVAPGAIAAAASVTRAAGPGADGLAGWLPLLALVVWGAGTVWLLLRLLLGLRAAGRLVRESTPLPETGLRSLAVEVAYRAGLRRPPQLRLSPGIASPVTTGWWRPRVLLPAEAEGWGTDRLRAVLAHEMGHVRRRDCLTQLLARLVAAVHWWNPLAWLAERRMVVERERACDDHVLADGTLASDYARHLLDIGQLVRGRREAQALRAAALSGVLIAGSASLTARVERLLDTGRSHRLPGRSLLAAVPATALLLALPAACLTGDPLAGEGAVRLVYKTADATRDETAATLTRRLEEMGLSSARVTVPDDEKDLPTWKTGRLVVDLPRMSAAERSSVRATLERRGGIAVSVVAEHEDGAIADLALRQLAAAAWGDRDFRWLGVWAVSPHMKGDQQGFPHPVALSIHGPREGLLRYLALVPRPPQPYAVLLDQVGADEFKTVLVDRSKGLLLERVVDARVVAKSREHPGTFEIKMTLLPEDAARMLAITSANIGRSLAIEHAGGELWGTPRIGASISTEVSITARGSRADADRLAAAFRAGSLPAPLTLVHTTPRD